MSEIQPSLDDLYAVWRPTVQSNPRRMGPAEAWQFMVWIYESGQLSTEWEEPSWFKLLKGRFDCTDDEVATLLDNFASFMG